MAHDLTAELHQGFDAEPGSEPPFLATSPSWLAWRLGRYFAERAMLKPKVAASSRGDAIRADNAVWVPMTESRTKWRRK